MIIPSYKRISSKKLDKTSESEDEIARMKHLNRTAVPAVVGILGMIKKNTDKHMKKILRKPSLSKF